MAGWRRFANLWRRGTVDAEIEEELRAHFEMAVEDGVRAGMTEGEARRAARMRFGNPVVMKERTVGMDAALGLDALGRDLKLMLRQLRKSPGFAVTVLLTLAIGIGANTAVFSLVQQVMLRTLPWVLRMAGLFAGAAADRGVAAESAKGWVGASAWWAEAVRGGQKFRNCPAYSCLMIDLWPSRRMLFSSSIPRLLC